MSEKRTKSTTAFGGVFGLRVGYNLEEKPADQISSEDLLKILMQFESELKISDSEPDEEKT